MIRLLVLLASMFLAVPAWAFSVAFINPGRSDEAYWLTASRAMEAAAKSLGIRLEVFYADRQHPRAIEIARQIVARPATERPDVVVVTNDYATAPELLRILDDAGIDAFLAFSGISEPADKLAIGAPRQRYKHWLGSLEPHAADAGYLTARALIARGRQAGMRGADGKLHLLAVSGDRSTPASIRRSEGMRKAIGEANDVVLEQEVFGEWRRDKAAEQAGWLYLRYPAARLVWTGSDQMAFGAMQAWEQRGGRPGKDMLFSGINTSHEAMAALKSGRLAALSGGHFICGAWSLVLLYDYAHGRDFARDEGVELDQSMFMLFSLPEAERFEQRFGELDFGQVDFRRYSKVLNPRLRRYNFAFRQLLQ